MKDTKVKLPYIGLMVVVFILYAFFLVFSISVLVSNNEKKFEFRGKTHFDQTFWKETLKKPEEGFRIQDTMNLEQGNWISAALYGNASKYYEGAVKLSHDIQKDLPGWQMLIFLHDQVEEKWEKYLLDNDAKVIRVKDPLIKPGNSAGMYWRFMPVCYKCRFISVDVDEDLNIPLLKKIIYKWEKSDQPYFRLVQVNPYPWPKHHVTGKYWGHDGNRFEPDISPSDMQNFPHRTDYGSDEMYLSYHMHPIMAEKGLLTVYPNVLSATLHTLSYPFYQKGKNHSYYLANTI